MIKVLIGYKVKKGVDVEPMLFNLTSHAMTYPGFVASENLRNTADSTIVAMIQTWDKADDWTAWESSTIRRSILEEAKPLLVDGPRVTTYRVMAARGWGGVTRSS